MVRAVGVCWRLTRVYGQQTVIAFIQHGVTLALAIGWVAQGTVAAADVAASAVVGKVGRCCTLGCAKPNTFIRDR